MSKLIHHWFKLVNWCTTKGIPIPLLRGNDGPSISFTMLVISFAMCVAALIGRVASSVGSLDFPNALQLFMVSSGLYFGRSLSKGDMTSVSTSTSTTTVSAPTKIQE